tara:strand:+ start:147 stop:1316 length:1170 start_codon:yes stop_codon:yes gene_type:complete
MVGDVFAIGSLELSTTPRVLEGAWFQRSVRDHVNGTVTVYDISGPHGLQAEIHYVQLENDERWVMMGETYSGPKWVWRQTHGRLRMSVSFKGDTPMFDLALPTPGGRNKDVYTMSCASVEDLEGVLPGYEQLLQTHGVTKIGQRMDLYGDTSSRKKFISANIESTDGLAPLIGFCITRLLSLIQTYEMLHAAGEVEEEFTHMVGDDNLKPRGGVVDELAQTIAGGESAYVEFKPAIWYDYGRAKSDPNYKVQKESHVSDNIVRTVAGFLNAEGGTLFIGVSDDGDAYGLEADRKLTGRKDWDGLENELNQLISTSVSNEISATKVKISLPTFQGQTIARVEVFKSNSPVFMKTRRHQNKFYVRIGNATNTMSVESAFNYISQHNWHSKK